MTFSSNMTCMAFPLVQIGIRQQRQEARAHDGIAELALVARLGAGDARRNDLAVFVDEIFQEIDVFVIDLLDLLDREATELLAAKQVLRAAFLVLVLLVVLAFALTA